MFAEEVDIVPKLPTNLQANLKSSKWKERKEALDDLLTLLNATPKIKDASELGDIAKSLATCVHKDANINCVMTAANCMEAMAKGMMKSFGRYREAVVAPMLERMKERKANVTDAIGAALDAVFATVRCSVDGHSIVWTDRTNRLHWQISCRTSFQHSDRKIRK